MRRAFSRVSPIAQRRIDLEHHSAADHRRRARSRTVLERALTLTRARLCTREQTRAAAGSIINQLRKELLVLPTVIVVLLVLWLLGVATSYTLGGLIHVLLVVAIVVVLLRIIQGRNPLRG
jgi:hypothetical protein